jgi:DNA-binding Lrp family transcriptional regulator
MVSAYILIETQPGMAGHVAERIRSFPFIRAVNAVTGPYDVICMVEAENMAEIGKNVMPALQKVEGVQRTLTCINVDH